MALFESMARIGASEPQIGSPMLQLRHAKETATAQTARPTCRLRPGGAGTHSAALKSQTGMQLTDLLGVMTDITAVITAIDAVFATFQYRNFSQS